MSWLRSAISKAAEVGGKNIAPNITRTVRSVAQHAGQAVAGGAKIVQDRLVGRNLTSSKNAIKRLDEVAQSARGVERVQALARWLGALKELGKEPKRYSGNEETKSLEGEELHEELSSPRRAAKVLFYDLDGDGEPMDFREIFLRSNAIENLVISMILESPKEEEINLLLEIFGLCLAGGRELHVAITSSIQDLAKAFTTYNEEIMSKREYLLQYARDAVSGLKLSADIERLDAEIGPLMHLISDKKAAALTEDGITKTKELLQLEVHLRDLLQRKRDIVISVKTKSSREEKVELLKTISTSLKQSAVESEKRIDEYRSQKQEAVKYRTAKAHEVSEMEKTVAAEVKALQQRRDELEAQLKEVKASLAVAMNRHINLQEEKQQFDEASTGVMGHLEAEEDELTRLIASQNSEANVLETWICFLEDTWRLQTSCTQKTEEDTLNAIVEIKNQFLQTLLQSLSYLKDELDHLVNKLKSCSSAVLVNANQKPEVAETEKHVEGEVKKSKKQLQEEFFETEGQIVSVLRTIEILKEEFQSFSTLIPGDPSDDEKKVTEAFNFISQLRKEVEKIDRPSAADLDDSDVEIHADSPKNSDHSVPISQAAELQADEFLKAASEDETHESAPKKDLDKDNNGDGINDNEETEGWEFDELEEELNKEENS